MWLLRSEEKQEKKKILDQLLNPGTVLWGERFYYLRLTRNKHLHKGTEKVQYQDLWPQRGSKKVLFPKEYILRVKWQWKLERKFPFKIQKKIGNGMAVVIHTLRHGHKNPLFSIEISLMWLIQKISEPPFSNWESIRHTVMWEGVRTTWL